MKLKTNLKQAKIFPYLSFKRTRKHLVKIKTLLVAGILLISIVFPNLFGLESVVEAAISYRGGNSSQGGGTSVTIGPHASTQPGDVMIAVFAALGGPGTVTPPAGGTWTQVGSTCTAGGAYHSTTFLIWYREYQPGDTTWQWTWQNNIGHELSIGSYVGVDGDNPIHAQTAAPDFCKTGTGTSLSANTITTTLDNTYVIGIWMGGNPDAGNGTSLNITPTSATERFEANNTYSYSCGALCTRWSQSDYSMSDSIQTSATSNFNRAATSNISLNAWSGTNFALTPAPPADQSSYRFSVNADNNNPSFIADNLSTADDRVRGTAFDSISSMFFAVGDNGTNWVIQKRRIADGALCTATNCGTTFGTDGRVTYDIPNSATEKAYDIDVDPSAGHIYIVGMDNVTGAGQWRIEKRNMMTGALVTAFGTGGIVNSNPSNGLDEALTLQLDTVGGYLYVGGYDNTGNNRWNLQKYRIDNGAICTAANCGSEFGIGGMYTYDASNGDDRISAIETDPTNTYLYVAGFTTAPNGRTSWTMQKLLASTAALCTAANCGVTFGTAGTYTSDPTTRDDQILALQVDSAGGAIYIGGYEQSTTSSRQWRIEKITLDVGTLIPAFGGTGCTTNVAGALCQSFTSGGDDKILSMELDGTGGFIYVLGIKDGAGSNSEWRVQKRNRSDGLLVSDWATGGTATVNPSANNDPPTSLVVDVDRGILWAAGNDRTLGTTNMQWYFVQLNLDSGTIWLAAQDTVAGVSTNITFRLRLLLHVATETFIPVNMKLQYAPKVGTCDTAFVGESYADVMTSSGEIRYHDNPSVADAAAAIAQTGDPSHSGHTTILESIEESNSFSAANSATTGQDALWDFVLMDSSAFGAYCFRVTNNDGSMLNSYSVIPEITFCKDDPKTSSQLRHGTYFCEGQKKAFFWAL